MAEKRDNPELLAAAKEMGVKVSNASGYSTQSVAELAMGLMFACSRYISIAGHTMREDKWEKKAYGKGIELQGKTLGIIGYGRIGQAVGKIAKAFGMKTFPASAFFGRRRIANTPLTMSGMSAKVKIRITYSIESSF